MKCEELPQRGPINFFFPIISVIPWTKTEVSIWRGFFPKNYVPKPFLCGWDRRVGGLLIIYPFRASSNSSMLTSNMWCFKIWLKNYQLFFYRKLWSFQISNWRILQLVPIRKWKKIFVWKKVTLTAKSIYFFQIIKKYDYRLLNMKNTKTQKMYLKVF